MEGAQEGGYQLESRFDASRADPCGYSTSPLLRRAFPSGIGLGDRDKITGIWTLQISTRSKIRISLIFAIGIGACISAAARLADTVEFAHSSDTVYRLSGMYLWALVEMTCLFLVFCITAAPKAFKIEHPARVPKIIWSGKQPDEWNVGGSSGENLRREDSVIVRTTHVTVEITRGEGQAGEYLERAMYNSEHPWVL
ncbi:hypothetical protein F5Y15DRAFT_420915 [Xylariaceae sp. FL0016]|nr:hypothetical protein F5Y15DRAFT_420915 [Xylariaceae sp. FL0016]